MISPSNHPQPAPRSRAIAAAAAAARQRSTRLKVEGFVAGLCFLAGTGIIGAPLARSLWTLGCDDFVLVDQTEYIAEDVGQECGPEEIGNSKASVVSRRLENRGAWAVATHTLREIFDPIYRPEVSFIIDAGDSPHSAAEIGSIAHEAQVPLFRVRVDPTTDVLEIRVFRHDGNFARCPHCDAASLSENYTAPAPPSRAAAELTAQWAAQMILASLENRGTALGDGQTATYRPRSGEGKQHREGKRCPACAGRSPLNPVGP